MKIFHNQDNNHSEQRLALALRQGLREFPVMLGIFPFVFGDRSPRKRGRADRVMRWHWWEEGTEHQLFTSW